eukprot:1599083-Rhodomonas_salina.3
MKNCQLLQNSCFLCFKLPSCSAFQAQHCPQDSMSLLAAVQSLAAPRGGGKKLTSQSLAKDNADHMRKKHLASSTCQSGEMFAMSVACLVREQSGHRTTAGMR